MYLKRKVIGSLESWYNSTPRKPLLIHGARQVGKSTAVKIFAEKTGLQLVEFNFEQTPDLSSFFVRDLDAQRILMDLETYLGRKFSQSTLLFFDEIQVCPEAIKALRYFFEQRITPPVIASGSLLEFVLEDTGMPVGRLALLYMHPLDFGEFLVNLGKEHLAGLLKCYDLNNLFPGIIHNELFELFALYSVVGGMPEVVADYIKNRDLQNASKLQGQIVNTFRQDFHKYARHRQVPHVEDVFNAIPRYLGQTFKYSFVSREFRAAPLAKALTLLEKAGIAIKVYHSHSNGLPLGAEIERSAFKVFFIDVGLAQQMCQLSLAGWVKNKTAHLINKGGVAEQLVAGELVALQSDLEPPQLFYWRRAKPGSSAEVDFVIAQNGMPVPIEVKSGQRRSSKSLRQFLNERPGSSLGIELAWTEGRVKAPVVFLPLYAVKAIPHALQYVQGRKN